MSEKFSDGIQVTCMYNSWIWVTGLYFVQSGDEGLWFAEGEAEIRFSKQWLKRISKFLNLEDLEDRENIKTHFEQLRKI